MKVINLLVLLVCSGVATGRGADDSRLPEGFTLTLERDGPVWKATCQRGCTWRELRYECRDRPCSVIVDAHGVAAAEARRTLEAPFAFRVSPTDDGWEATRVRGSSWTKVSWGCKLRMFCEARVDEGGVRPGWI
jgi:hypothetical protein